MRTVKLSLVRLFLAPLVLCGLGGGALAQTNVAVTRFVATVTGDQVAVDLEICNRGSASATFAVQLFLDRTAAPACGGGGADLEGTVTLAGGACLTFADSVSGVPPGSYRAWLFADSDCALSESDEADNLVSAPYAVGAGSTDLRVSAFTATVTGSDVAYSLTVCNSGPAPRPFAVAVFLDRVARPTCAEASLADGAATFAVGAAACFTEAFTVPGAAAGTYRTWLLADAACQVPESDETNNARDALVVVGPAVRATVAFPALPRFTRPVDLQAVPDGRGRLVVLEQAGKIYIFENRAGVSTRKLFLDLSGKVSRAGNEMGLLGLAFHPGYATNGRFFVNYTAASPRRTVVAGYRVDPTDPDRADPASEVVHLIVPQPFSNHNAGQLAFGPDGMLYVGLGDGGNAGDPFGNAQDRRTLLGSMLRIDVDRIPAGKTYGIPADNPLVGNKNGWREEIWAWGLRNPWRYSFDPLTGALWLGDVGQNRWEEIDIVERGKNYGWNVMEGNHCFKPATGCSTAGLTLPVWEYRNPGSRSVTGGFVYRGKRHPQLAGHYIYGDYVTGEIWRLWYDGVNPPTNVLIEDTTLRIASFGLDADGEIYILPLFDGRIYTLR